MAKDQPKPRDDTLWQNVNTLVQHIYSLLDDIVVNFSNEEWSTVSKLRNAANDSLFYTAQAVGSVAPEITTYDYNNARKNLFTLQTMYTFAGKQRFTKLDPDVVVNIDEMLAEIDARMQVCQKELEKKNKEELEPWLEKYRIWQKMHD